MILVGGNNGVGGPGNFESLGQSLDNGQTFAAVATVPPLTDDCRCIRRNGNLWVAVNDSGDIAVSTDNAATWTVQLAVVPVRSHAIDISGARWHVVGTQFADVPGHTYAYSDDQGATWVPQKVLDFEAYAIAGNGTTLVMVGGDSTCFIAWSDDDGVTWTKVLGLPFNMGQAYDVKWNGSYFLLAGVDAAGPTPTVFARSTDGKIWTGLGEPAPWDGGNGNVFSLLWDAPLGRWWAGGFGGPSGSVSSTMAYSDDDGATWTSNGWYEDPLGPGYWWSAIHCISYDGSVYVVAGAPGFGTAGVVWSLDGFTWNQSTYASAINNIQLTVCHSAAGFRLIRAIARGGQIVRAVFTEEPKHESATGIDDALNHANYTFAVTAGGARALVPVAIYPTLVSYPAFGLRNAGEWGVDIQVDKQVTIGLSYEVTANNRIISAAGAVLIAPYNRGFVGAQAPTYLRQSRSMKTLTDFASDPLTGGPIVDDSGDWATEAGLAGIKKRCLRRIITQKNSFAGLPGYGLPIDIKRPMTTAKLTDARTEIAKQVKLEPEVTSCSTSITMDQRGYLTVNLRARTSAEQDVDVVVQAADQGVG